jgi:hypothetical protein
MAINIFEGARRVTKLIAVIWVLGMSFYAFTEKSYISAYFRVDLPDALPIRMTEQEACDQTDVKKYLSSQHTSKGSDVSVTICFKPYIKIDDELPPGAKFIDEEPAKPQQAQQPGLSFEEWKAQKEIMANFKLSKADEEWVDGVAWSKRLEKIKTSATVTIGGLAFLWIFSWCVGWVVRGFAGIPTGQDFKP